MFNGSRVIVNFVLLDSSDASQSHNGSTAGLGGSQCCRCTGKLCDRLVLNTACVCNTCIYLSYFEAFPHFSLWIYLFVLSVFNPTCCMNVSVRRPSEKRLSRVSKLYHLIMLWTYLHKYMLEHVKPSHQKNSLVLVIWCNVRENRVFCFCACVTRWSRVRLVKFSPAVAQSCSDAILNSLSSAVRYPAPPWEWTMKAIICVCFTWWESAVVNLFWYISLNSAIWGEGWFVFETVSLSVIIALDHGNIFP